MCSRCWRLYQTLLSLILPAENMDVLPRRKGCDGLGFGRKKKKKKTGYLEEKVQRCPDERSIKANKVRDSTNITASNPGCTA